MKIQLINIGKRFNFNWIVKDISFTFESNKTYAIKGNNGAGKTTLLTLISGYALPSQGNIVYTVNNTEIHASQCYKHFAIASPGSSVPEDFFLEELFDFQRAFKPFIQPIDYKIFESIIDLKNIKNKTISQYSTGMKQRVKLAMALLSSAECILLDEPTSNFDKNAITWYQNLLQEYSKNKIIIIASNADADFVNIADTLQL